MIKNGRASGLSSILEKGIRDSATNSAAALAGVKLAFNEESPKKAGKKTAAESPDKNLGGEEEKNGEPKKTFTRKKKTGTSSPREGAHNQASPQIDFGPLDRIPENWKPEESLRYSI